MLVEPDRGGSTGSSKQDDKALLNGAVEAFCDTSLLRRVGSSKLVMPTLFSGMGLYPTVDVLATAVTAQKLKTTAKPGRKLSLEVTEGSLNFTLLTQEIDEGAARGVIDKSDEIGLAGH